MVEPPSPTFLSIDFLVIVNIGFSQVHSCTVGHSRITETNRRWWLENARQALTSSCLVYTVGSQRKQLSYNPQFIPGGRSMLVRLLETPRFIHTWWQEAVKECRICDSLKLLGKIWSCFHAEWLEISHQGILLSGIEREQSTPVERSNLVNEPISRWPFVRHRYGWKKIDLSD